MLDIQLIELLSFFRHIGLAVVAASAFWGLILLRGARRTEDLEKKEVCSHLSQKILVPLGSGAAVSIAAWILTFLINPVVTTAHGGVDLNTQAYEPIVGFGAISFLFFLLAVVSVVGFRWYRKNREKFERRIRGFYLSELVIASILISVPTWTGNFGTEQLFLLGHSFHSILTVGTVIVLDFIFFATESVARIKRQLYPLLPTVSKVIWIGLGIGFLSEFLIFSESLVLTPKFFFMQTVIAILIMNGAFLAGPMNRKLMESVKGGNVRKLSPKWIKIEGFAGVISISSWGTITFLDFLKGLTVSYGHLAVFYIGLLIVVYGIYVLIEKTRPRL